MTGRSKAFPVGEALVIIHTGIQHAMFHIPSARQTIQAVTFPS